MSTTLTLPEKDPGKLARLDAVKADDAAPGIVFQRLCEGETLRDIARAWELPVGRFTQWFTDTHMALFDAALRVRADQIANEALAIADEQHEATDSKGNKFDPEVPRDKLRVDTRLKLAAQFDRARYGAKDSGVAGGGVTVIVDRSCGGTVEITAGGVSARVPISGAEASRPERIINETEGAI